MRTTTVRRRPRPRRDTPGILPTTLKGLLAGTLTLAFIALGISAFNGVPGKSYSTMYARVPQAGNLIRHDSVRIGGVRVGQVASRDITDDGQAEMRLQLQHGIQLPVDTKVAVRANGLLGARYVELLPGRSHTMLRERSTIRGGANALSFGVPEILDTFNAQTRGHLGKMVNGLGTGLLGNGRSLNQMLGSIDAEVRPVREVVHAILARPGAAARLVPALAAGMQPLADNRQRLTQLPGAAATALQPLVAERHALGATLHQAPGALTATTHGLGNGQRLLAAADYLATQVAATLPPAPAGLRATTALLRDSSAPLQTAEPLLRDVPPSVDAAVKITAALQPVLPQLNDGITNLLMPVLRKTGPYGCDFENFGATFRSMTGFGGQGTGPNGPPGEFRAYVATPSFGHFGGVKEPTQSLGHRESYSPPCTHPSKRYDVAGVRKVSP